MTTVGIRISSRGILRGKTGRVVKNVIADIMEAAGDSPFAPVTVHHFSKIESNSSISISCSGAYSPFVVVVFFLACLRVRSDR
jgi:hypothetical protein